MKYLILTLAILISACGKEHYGSWPAEVDQYVRLYSEMSRQYGKYSVRIEEVTITMTDKPLDQTGRVIGVCRPNSNSIEIYTAYWNKASQHERQVLIFHELGHCVHLLDHKNTVDPASGWPASIMYPYILSGFQYESWYNYYNSELFNGSAVRTPAAEQRCEL